MSGIYTYRKKTLSFNPPLYGAMTLPISHKQLVEVARQRADEYRAKQEQQSRIDDDFTFAKIGEYIPSEAEKEQLRRLESIQLAENKTVFDSRVRF